MLVGVVVLGGGQCSLLVGVVADIVQMDTTVAVVVMPEILVFRVVAVVVAEPQ